MKRYLYLTVFFAGMSTLALEFSASRLLGSVFGTSNLVWASIIGLILIYLTVGYFAGGAWADRDPRPATMYHILAWGAFLAGLAPLVARPVLRFAAGAFDQLQIGVLFGSFTAVLILFSIPVTLLGMISPFAIRLAIRDPNEAGRVSGRIYAISTLGSFIGTFLPVLVFIPLVGTTWTFIIFSELLLLVALIGAWMHLGWGAALRLAWMFILLLVLGGLLTQRPIKDTPGQIYEGESAYNYIEVLEQDGFRLLRLNEGQGVHSMWHPTELDYHGPWEQFLAAPFFNPAPFDPSRMKSMAIIGLAAGTVARQTSEVYGLIPIDGFEIDPQIIEVGREYFGMEMPNLNAIAQDGRVGLEHSKRQYTVIGVDAYRPPYIPWHLTTVEFFELVRAHLSDDGVLAVNVGRSPDDRRLIDGLAGTIQQVFPSVYVMDVPDSFNSMIYATVRPTRIEDFYQNLLDLYSRQDVHPLLLRALERVVANLQPTPQSQVIYTDDRAPIEWITNSMVLNYVLHGGIDELTKGSGQ
ncbi:MAG: fused MFS/spermidine synthase [Anaerolineales bacterium]|jgi:spermidine synthase|nr:fused MFS/spermidine synthase [Anaerolineales bacterium]